MSKITKNKDNAEIKDESKNVLDSLLKEHEDLHYNFDEQINWKCSTGSLLLDTATGGIRPSMWRLCGTNNCGKTPQALEVFPRRIEIDAD